MSRYEPKSIEPKWQAAWEAAQVFAARRDPAKPKYYVQIPRTCLHRGLAIDVAGSLKGPL